MLRILTVVFAFLALFLLCVGTATILVGPAVERDLVSKAEAELGTIDDFPLEAATISADGREVRVEGTVRRKQHLKSAGVLLERIEGVASLDNQLTFVPLDPWLVVERGEDGAMRAKGVLANLAEKGRLSMAVRDADGQAELSVEATVDGDVAEAPWLEPVGRILPEVLTTDRVSSVRVKDGTVNIGGDVYSKATAAEVGKRVAAVFRESGFAIENDLDVVRPPLAPWIVLEKDSSGVLVARGALSSSKQKHELLGIATSELEGVKITNRVESGSNVAPPEWWKAATTVLPAVIAELDPCALEIRDNLIRLSGEVVSEPMRESLSSLLEQNFPAETWKQSIAITVKEPPEPSRLSAIVFSGEQIFLKGVLPSTQVKKKVLDLAGQRIPGKEIVDQIELRANAVDPKWLDAFAGFLPGYSENAFSGGMTVEDAQLVIEARVDSDAKWDALFALAEKYFPMSEFRHRIELRVVDPLAPDPEDPLGPVDPDAVGLDGEGG